MGYTYTVSLQSPDKATVHYKNPPHSTHVQRRYSPGLNTSFFSVRLRKAARELERVLSGQAQRGRRVHFPVKLAPETLQQRGGLGLQGLQALYPSHLQRGIVYSQESSQGPVTEAH